MSSPYSFSVCASVTAWGNGGGLYSEEPNETNERDRVDSGFEDDHREIET